MILSTPYIYNSDTFSGLRLPPIFDMFRIKIQGLVCSMNDQIAEHFYSGARHYAQLYVNGPVNYDE
nr:MAG TPA: hypothetical protein [Bacteriophage sp.]